MSRKSRAIIPEQADLELWYYGAMTDQIEQVLVIESDWVHQLHQDRGLIKNIHPDFFTELASRSFFMDRPEAEKDPTFRQIIPYVMVFHEGKYLTVTRMKTQGESRLHNLMSVGIGGHINPVDEESKNILDAAMKRELSEELAIDDPPGWDDLDPLGLICDEKVEVSRVHLGVVFRWAAGKPVNIRETDKMHGEYLEPSSIKSSYDRLENWSQLVYDGLISRD